MKKRNKKNTILALLIGFCAIISLLMPIIISFFPVLIFGYELEYSSKVITGEITLIEPNDYNKTIKETRDFTSRRLQIFPDCIEKPQNHFWYVESFYCVDWGRDAYRMELFLEREFENDNNYNNEVNRLLNIEFKEKKTVFVKDLFDLSCIIVTYNDRSYFEYALLEDETKTIRYVYFF